MAPQYPALPPQGSGDHIRLLELDPGRLESPLKGKVVVVPLASAPPYEGLSYAWGDDKTPVANVETNGGNLGVAYNLHRALQRVRYRHQSRRLWIDAICISQTSAQEKSAQVALMEKIFSGALRVLIWLGDSNLCPKTNWSVVMGLIMRPPTLGMAGMVFSPWRAVFAVWDAYCNHVDLLQDVLSSNTTQWADRKWTAQEFKLARALTLCFGSRSVTFPYWRLSTIDHARPDFVRLDIRGASHEEWSHFYTAADELFNLQLDLPSGEMSLYDVWQRLKAKDASDQRDHVYALLGMISAAEAKDIGSDYTIDFTEVYAKATLAIMKSDRKGLIYGLQALDRVTCASSRHNALPSWAIDFSAVYEYDPTVLSRKASRVGVIPYDTKTDVSDLLAGHEPFTSNPGTYLCLSIRGRQLDKVAPLSHPFIMESKEFSGPNASAPFVADMKRYVGEELKRALERIQEYEAASRTYQSHDPLIPPLVAKDDYTAAIHLYHKVFTPSLSLWDSMFRKSPLAKSFPLYEDEIHATLPENWNVYKTIWKYLGYSEDVGTGNRSSALAFLSSGLLILAPDVVEPGDVVVMASGPEWPLLLRPRKGGDWEFRSLVYVHSISYTELVKEWKGKSQGLDEQFNIY